MVTLTQTINNLQLLIAIYIHDIQQNIIHFTHKSYNFLEETVPI